MQCWTWLLGATLVVIVTLTEAFNPDTIQCCDCKEMWPSGIGTVKPQISPSPFEIKIAPDANRYTPLLDINVNLTSIVEGRSFVSFMIQARRTNVSLNREEPIGEFKVIGDDPVLGGADCTKAYGAAFVSSDTSPKTNVQLAWLPHKTFQGHVEFRVTFVEDNNLFWVKEKSRPMYDPNHLMPPQMPLKYIPPPIPTIDVSLCGSHKGCYRIPEGCRQIECLSIFTWREAGLYMEFEMSTLTDGFNDRYFAVGFSDDIYMGDDFVFECVHNSDTGEVNVYQSFNYNYNHTVGVFDQQYYEDSDKNIKINKRFKNSEQELLLEDSDNYIEVHKNIKINQRFKNSQLGLSKIDGSYNEGRLSCRFRRKKMVNDVAIDSFELLTKPHHILMARGRAYRGSIGRHGLTVGTLPAVSPDKVDLLYMDDITGLARYHMVKAHACLMLLAFVFFAPIGLIWMKYYTTMWPNSRFMGNRYWAVVHFNCTFWVILLVVIGVILIFVEVEGWSRFPDLPQKAHPILGIIVFICILVIPIIALIRCPENHTCRPIGNWLYWLFWTIAFCLAIPNIFIGMEFGKAMVPWWLTWVLCIFFLFNLICEVILEVHQCCTHKKNKERRKKWELQKKENPKVVIPEPWPAGRVFKRNVLFTHFIVCLIVVIIAVITVAVS